MSGLKKFILPVSVIVVAVILPLILTGGYYQHVLIGLLTYILLGASVNLTNGYGGHLNVGQGAFAGMGGYTAALMALHLGAPFWLTIPAAGIVGALVGLIVCVPSMKLWGAYLLVATICAHYALTWMWLNWRSVFGGEGGLGGVSGFSIHLGNFDFEFVGLSEYYLVLAIVVICLVIIYRVIVSSFGRDFVAIREDEILSKMIGIATVKTRAVCFTIGAFFMGIAGALIVHHFHAVAPVTFHVMETFAVVVMVIIGGQGTFAGPIVGAILYVGLMEVLRPAKEFTPLIYGILLILFLIFVPGGLVGLWNTAYSKVRRKVTLG